MTTVSPTAKPWLPTVVMVTVEPVSVAAEIRLSLARAVPWSTVAVGFARPEVGPALNVAVAVADGLSVCESWPAGIVPSGPAANVMGKPAICVRLALDTAAPWLSRPMVPVRLLIPVLILILDGLPWLVSTMNGSKQILFTALAGQELTAAAPLLMIELEGTLLPHQLVVAVTWFPVAPGETALAL